MILYTQKAPGKVLEVRLRRNECFFAALNADKLTPYTRSYDARL